MMHDKTKRLITVCLMAFAMMFMLAACGQGNDDPGADGGSAGDGNIKIVATIFPEYDWAKNILGDNPAGAELTMLLDSGVDLHSFQPSAEDMMKISECDLFIYVGGESDAWVEDALAKAVNKDMIVINLMEVLGDSVRKEEIKEGMEAERGEEEPENDEHVWLSLKNAQTLCAAVADGLAAADPENAGVYKKNLEEYRKQLAALDGEYSSAVSDAPVRTLLFGDRFPFRYMTDDYGLDYYAAFAGCSAETEASFETIRFLAGKVDELGLPCVLTIDGSDQKIAKTIVQSTKSKDQKILTLDSMQSVTDDDIKAGASYLSIMEDNLKTLKAAAGK